MSLLLTKLCSCRWVCSFFVVTFLVCFVHRTLDCTPANVFVGSTISCIILSRTYEHIATLECIFSSFPFVVHCCVFVYKILSFPLSYLFYLCVFSVRSLDFFCLFLFLFLCWFVVTHPVRSVSFAPDTNELIVACYDRRFYAFQQSPL